MSNISNLGLTQILTGGLQSQQTTLSLLTQQLSSSQKYSNLTSYDPTDAHNILSLQSLVTQRQSYISSINNVQARLTVYDTSMSDIESMAALASSLASQNQAYSSTTVADVQQQATNYLKQLTDDLNQQVGGRYIYAGTRYNTKPVSDLSSLTGAPTTTTTTSPALPSYDTDYSNATSFTVNSSTAPTGNFTVGNVSIPWSEMAAGGPISTVSVNGVSTALTTPVTLSAASTPTALAANMATTINAIAPQMPASSGIASLTATSNSGTVTMNFNGTTPQSVTPDASGTPSDITWVGGSAPDGTIAQTPNSSVAANTKDSVLVDSSYSVTYGVTSNDASFQQLINGLRYITAATAAGKSGDTATYQADMKQATSLINSGLSGIQTIHAGVADNQNILTNEVSTQNSDITSLEDQLTNIQQVDLTQVGTEINLMQTQMQASYSATASLEQLSLVKYL